MLGKLLKYEFKGLLTPVIIMLCVLFGTTTLALITFFSINPELESTVNGVSVMLAMFAVFLYYIGIIGTSIGIILIIAIRFYKTCYTDQGYLTHTLPVTKHQLIGAKTLASIISYLVVMVSIAISVVTLVCLGGKHFLKFDTTGSINTLLDLFKYIGEGCLEAFGVKLNTLIFTYSIVIFISCITSVIIAMGCISLGQLYAKHRIIGAIIAYFIIAFLQQTLGSIYSTVFYSSVLTSNNVDMTMYKFFMPQLLWTTIVQVIFAVVLYFVNIYMAEKKLNLE